MVAFDIEVTNELAKLRATASHVTNMEKVKLTEERKREEGERR